MSIDQKLPFGQALSAFTANQTDSGIQSRGRAWPCYVTGVNGSIVTVKFAITTNETVPEVTVPVFGPEYIRYPIQLGDKGFVVPADVSLRDMSGLGVGVPDFSNPGNLTALVFMPIGNANWFDVNGQYLVMYGPEGVILSTKNMDCTLTLTHTGITINLNGGNLTVNNGNTTMNGNLTVNGLITGTQGFNISGGSTTATVTGNVDITGTLSNNGKLVGSTHTHGGVQTGGGTTGVPT